MAVKRKQHVDPPLCNCALLCEDVVQSIGRGKHILQGVVDRLFLQSLPCPVQGLVCYVRLTNVHHGHEILLTMVDAEEEEPLFEAKAHAKGDHNPLQLSTIIFPLPPFLVSKPGRYYFRVMHDADILAASPIDIQAPESLP